MTIRNFRDHAANERTLLAWIRTAVAVIAFGFLVERFDLILEIYSSSLSRRTISAFGQQFGSIAGLVLVAFGTIQILIAIVRFHLNAKRIEADGVAPRAMPKLDLVLSCLSLLIGVAMFVYLSYAFVAKLN